MKVYYLELENFMIFLCYIKGIINILKISIIFIKKLIYAKIAKIFTLI